MRDNALRIGHNPVLFDVLRDLFGECYIRCLDTHGLVMDWRISQGLAGWSEIGNIHILLCKCSSRIGIGLTLNWQIGHGLPMDWLRLARWSGV